MRTHWLWTVLTSVTLSMALGVGGCEESNADGDGGGTGSRDVSCGVLEVTVGSGPEYVFSHPNDDTYGLNSFYVWELDVAGTAETPEYHFLDTGEQVTGKVSAENWEIPETLWSAARFGLDGEDPYQFDVDDQFVLGYLPATPGVSSWTSKHGAKNDGTCPDGSVDVGGYPSCLDDKQRDLQAPVTLESGKSYLFRMLMIIPLGEDKNRVQSCYQSIESF